MTLLSILGGLFRLYSEIRHLEAADYIAQYDPSFGPGHLQYSVLPSTVSIIISKKKNFQI